MSSRRYVRRKLRRDRLKISQKLKKRLFGHLFMSPCCYCHKVFMVETLTIEHIIPLSLGGTHDKSNIALACAPCNHQKGKESWHRKRQMMKEYHEQHSSQH